MKNSLKILLISLFIFSCGENFIEEISHRKDYLDRDIKIVKYYRLSDEKKELVKQIEYFVGGNICSEKFYKNSELHGICTNYWYNNNKVDEVNYINGLKDGFYKSWNKDGTLRSEEHYKNGSLNGKSTFWWSPEIPKSVCNYKDGEIDGEEIRYFDNGSIWLKQNFKNGVGIGEWIEYNLDGSIKQKGTW